MDAISESDSGLLEAARHGLAEVAGIEAGAVKARLHRARETLPGAGGGVAAACACAVAPVPIPAARAGERFSLQNVRVAINGKTIAEERNTWMRGGGLMIHLPGCGEFYLALSPSPDFPLQPSAWIERKTGPSNSPAATRWNR